MSKPNSFSRRRFLQTTAMATAASMSPGFARAFAGPAKAEREFRLCLNPGNIGVKADQKELLQMAIEYDRSEILSRGAGIYRL